MRMFLVPFLVLLAYRFLENTERIYINYQQSGGFAGISRSIEIDSDTLDAEEQVRLEQLINDADFFELEVDSLKTNGLPDEYQYVIVIEKEGKKRSISVRDSLMPDKLRPLINYLSRKTRSIKRQ